MQGFWQTLVVVIMSYGSYLHLGLNRGAPNEKLMSAAWLAHFEPHADRSEAWSHLVKGGIGVSPGTLQDTRSQPRQERSKNSRSVEHHWENTISSGTETG